jgi:hypothetical protein
LGRLGLRDGYKLLVNPFEHRETLALTQHGTFLMREILFLGLCLDPIQQRYVTEQSGHDVAIPDPGEALSPLRQCLVMACCASAKSPTDAWRQAALALDYPCSDATTRVGATPTRTLSPDRRTRKG